MPVGRKPEIAGRLFVEALGSVTSCVTRQRLDVASYAYPPNEPNTAVFAEPVSLRSADGGPSGLFLDVTHMFMIVEADQARLRRRWRVTTRMYEYRLLDHNQRELLVYHWQPGEDFKGPDHPHVHVSATLRAQIDGAKAVSIDLHGLHLVTGRVSLEAVVRMVIGELHIAPQRADWRESLDRMESIFLEGAMQRV